MPVDPDASVDGPGAGDSPTAGGEPSSTIAPGTTGDISDDPPESDPESSPSDSGLNVGETVGRYVLLRPVASGGMGMVFVAYDPELDRNIALKLLLPPRRRRVSIAEGQAHLLREAQAMAQLSHPNVVQVYDVGTWRDRVYVALEYVEGLTLDRWIKQRPRPWREVLPVLLDAGRGLAAAHEAGLIHLDFKPSNVLVGADEVARVLDFGLARRFSGSKDRVSADGMSSSGVLSRSSAHGKESRVVAGTPGYIAPEQYLLGQADEKADQFSFAVTAWEALYGQRPHRGRDRKQLRKHVVTGRIDDPPRGVFVPAWVRKALLRALLPRPQDRWPTMRALLGELGRDPMRTRRRFAVVGVVVIAFSAASYGYHRAVVAERQLCRDGEHRLDGVWDEQRRRDVASALSDSGVAYAEVAASSVEVALDAYASDWVAMYREACEATRMRGEQSEALLDRRMWCLEQRRQQMSALTELLAEANETDLEHAFAAASDLPDVSACADVDRLRADDDRPRDATLRARSEELAADLARAKATYDAGRIETARTLVASALKEAHEAGLDRREAEALLLEAELASDAGDVEGAVAAALEAFWLAERSSAERVRLAALNNLVWFTGHQKAKPRQALWYASQGRAIASRLGLKDEDIVDLMSNEAAALMVAGRADEAIQRFETAVDACEGSDRCSELLLATALNNLGSAYFSTARYDEAAIRYERARAMRRELLGAEHPVVGDSLISLGNLASERAEFEEAVTHFREAARIIERAHGPGDPDLHSIDNNLALALSQLGRYEEAEAALERARRGWALVAPDHPNVVGTLSNLADLYLQMRDPDAAVVPSAKAVEIGRRALPPDHMYLAHALCGLGRARLELGQVDEALALLRESVDIFAAGEADREALAEARFALGRAMWQRGEDRKEARDLVDLARADFAEAGPRAMPKLRATEQWLKETASR